MHGLIRTWVATDATRHDGAQLPNLISKADTGSHVWADTAYRSKANEKHLADHRLVSRIHRKKPKGRPMPANVARANGAKSRVRSAVEHVLARQKGPMGLVVRTIGIARATVKIGLANIAYNMKRAVWLADQPAPARPSHRGQVRRRPDSSRRGRQGQPTGMQRKFGRILNSGELEIGDIAKSAAELVNSPVIS